MMARRSYDRLMLATKIGSNRKIRRLQPAQRWAHVAGVLALAAESPVPGHLLIADGVPVNSEDVAEHASVSLAVAENTMKALRELGVVKYDYHAGCEYVHDWDEWNPAPKSDPTAANRMKRYRERLRNADRNGDESYDRNADRNDSNGDGTVRQEVEVGSEKWEGTTSSSNRSFVPDPPSGSNVVELSDVERSTKSGEAA